MCRLDYRCRAFLYVDFSLAQPQTDVPSGMATLNIKAPKLPSDIATLVSRNANGLFARAHSVELIAREDHIRALIAEALKGK